ncbi:MAG: hypothetical protein NZV14_10570 [Bryobacteraceae bacterium]|nr:hypothetical protein [Bryobacteraceae bacterium]MDW8378597.1 hypothetical protein [Bryobacterales bacterium]
MKAATTPTARTAVLVVTTDPEDLEELRAILPSSDWNLYSAFSVAEAREMLRHHSYPIIITEAGATGLMWKTMLGYVSSRLQPPSPKLIVASASADDQLWAEVLNQGGFNVLAKPYDAREVRWVLDQARAEVNLALEQGKYSH